MTHSFRSDRGSSMRRNNNKSRRVCRLEPLERRELLTASALANGVGTTIEYTGPFSTFLPVGSGPNSYSGFSSFGNIDVPASAFALNSGVSGVNNLSLNLFNTATSGKFAPTDGSFAVYFVPNNTTPVSSMRFGGPTGTKAGTQVDLAAIGTTTGGASTLGIDSSDLVGTFSVTSGLPQGYSTFTFNSLGGGAKTGIATDLNNGTNVRFVVVSLDNTGKADWEGSFNNEYPQVQLDVNQAPLVSFGSSSFSVNEVDQISGHTTVATISVHRSGNPSTSLDINYQTSDVTAHQPADYTAASGVLHWDAGDTSDKTFTVSFNDITTSDPSRSISLSLTDHGGNPIAPVFPAGGSTAPLTINYLQAGQVFIDQSSYNVNETAGTVAIKIDRTGSNVNSSTADVTLSTASGLAYQNDPQNPQDAQAGRDFGTSGNTTAPTYAVHFAAGQSQATINVPLINVATFAGTRSFTASLSNVSTGTQITTPGATTVAITDNTVANSDTPTGITTQTSGVETNGPFYVNNFMNLASTPHSGFGFATMPVLTFGAGSTVFTGTTASTVDSLKLSLFNLATSGSFAGTPGSFDLYLLTDNTVDDTALVYGGGNGTTGPAVIGTQATPIYVGTANFTNNQVGYNDFVFDNLPAAVRTALASDLNSGGASQIRFAITPSQGSPVAADWEGNYLVSQPQLTLLTETGTVAATPPTITGVVVDGTSWSPTALSALQAAGQGNGLGYSFPVGSTAQLNSLPWGNVNQVQVTFSEAVNVSQSSLSVTGVNGSYAVSNFSYNPSTFTATWTLVNGISRDRLNLVVHASGAGAVTDTAGDPLDGEWTNGVSSYPSGNGTAGGDFNFGFNVLPGDANQDGVVNAQDLAIVSSGWLKSGPHGDVNADGIINAQDLAAISSSWLATLPAGGAQASVESAAVTVAPAAQSAAATSPIAIDLSSIGPIEGNFSPSIVQHSAVLSTLSTASFAGPIQPDRVAAFVGRFDAAAAAGVAAPVSSQGTAAGNGQVTASGVDHQSSITDVLEDDLLTSNIDDELLSVVASARSGKNA
ncbi:MAG TPA: Calx-beta domain-containing protein [Pirellulales bacterium]|jgi:hypothetical protein